MDQQNRNPSDAVRLTWMGTAGCRITDGETAFLIDPFVSRPGLLKVFLRFRLAPGIDLIEQWCRNISDGVRTEAVVVSHSHYDHAMDAPFFARETGAILAGSESTAWVGRGAGLAEDRIRIVAPEDTLDVGRFKIRFLKSMHGPALFGRIPFPGAIDRPITPPASSSKYRLGETFTLLIEHPAGTLVHNGSAGYMPGMFEGITADTVLQGIAGRRDTRTLFENILLPLKAPTVIPIHYDDFFSPLDKPIRPLRGVNLEEFERTAALYAGRVRTRFIPLGRKIDLLPDHLP